MTKGKNQHVVPHPDGWAVKGAGNSKATKITSNQAEAIKIAEGIARNQKSRICPFIISLYFYVYISEFK